MPIFHLPQTAQKLVIKQIIKKNTVRFALYILLLEKQKGKEQSPPFMTMLDNDGKRCRDCQIPHAALQSPKESSFVTLFESGDDQALITLTGFDHATFQELHNLFAPVFNAFTPFSRDADGSYLKVNPSKKSGDHLQSIDSIAGLLAIVLSWSCTQDAA
jgi:hypothetical protein